MIIPAGIIRGFMWGALCMLAIGVLIYVLSPRDDLPPEVAIGTIVIPRELFEKQLEEVSTRKGVQKITQKDVAPVSHAVAPAGASSIVERFVAAAGPPQQDSSVAVADDGTGEPLPTAPAARDTVCLGVGGSQRKNQLTLLSACVPGSDGVIDRYRGRNFDWSYVEGRPVVSVTRGPDLASWAKWTLLLGAAVYVGMQVEKRINH